MPPKHDDADVNETPRLENAVLGVKSVWAIFGALVLVLSFMLDLRFKVGGLDTAIADTNRKFDAGMTVVNQKLSELDRVSKLESRIEALKENGSDAVKALALDVARIRHDFDVHVAETVRPQSSR